MDVKNIIEPERQGLWIAAVFILALVAFVIAFVALQRTNTVLAGMQAQVFVLNSKIESLKADSAPAASTAPVAEAVAATATETAK